MLTKEEAEEIKLAILSGTQGNKQGQIAMIDRVTEEAPYDVGSDVIAKGPKLSSTQMLDEAARAFGWRTDWACGDSPITWDLVLEEIRKYRKAFGNKP